MKTWKIAFLTLAFTLVATSIFAHALWIETAATGQVGKAQTVRIYYGEYVAGERDSVSKWYSDVKDFTLYVVGPDQKKVQLKTTGALNYYEAKFTPITNGIYTLAVSHKAKELGGTTLYHFLASANVAVGKPAAGKVAAVNTLQLQANGTTIATAGKEVQLKGILNNQAAGSKKISVFSPNGWTKELTTNTAGEVSFTAPFRGLYVIEISDMDKTGGQHYGKEYKAAWSGATYSLEVR